MMRTQVTRKMQLTNLRYRNLNKVATLKLNQAV